MPLTIHDVARQVSLPLDLIEAIAERVAAGAEETFSVKTVRKRRGGIRDVVHPGVAMHHVVRNLARAFDLLPYHAPDHVHGFVRGRSTITNAAPHVGARCVLRVDLEDFFPTIDRDSVNEALQGQGYDEKAAELCTKLVTVHRKLPIGLSTSPFISNLVFQKTDDALATYAADATLVVTRYVDDFAFSPNPSDRNLREITEILEGFGWSVNPAKTAFLRRGSRQYVTGLNVAGPGHPRLPRKLKRQLAWAVYMIERVGWEEFDTRFVGPLAGRSPFGLHGLACYFAAVEPDVGWPLKRRLEAVLPGFEDDDNEEEDDEDEA